MAWIVLADQRLEVLLAVERKLLRQGRLTKGAVPGMRAVYCNHCHIRLEKSHARQIRNGGRHDLIICPACGVEGDWHYPEEVASSRIARAS